MAVATLIKNATGIQPHLWTREEFDNMVLAGIFQPEARLELIEGEILEMTTQSSWHSTAVQLTQETLQIEYGKGFVLRIQMPLAVNDDSEPIPDIAIVSGSPRDYREAHPTMALLIIEVSRSTLEYDRGRKLRLYARCGIPEYWIINLIDQHLEVYRHPIGESYSAKTTLQLTDTIAPLSQPEALISVADLFP